MYNGINDYKKANGNLKLTYEEHFKSHRPDGLQGDQTSQF